MLMYIRMRGRGIRVTGSHGRGVQWVIRLCGVWLKLHWLDRTQPTQTPPFVLCALHGSGATVHLGRLTPTL